MDLKISGDFSDDKEVALLSNEVNSKIGNYTHCDADRHRNLTFVLEKKYSLPDMRGIKH